MTWNFAKTLHETFLTVSRAQNDYLITRELALRFLDAQPLPKASGISIPDKPFHAFLDPLSLIDSQQNYSGEAAERSFFDTILDKDFCKTAPPKNSETVLFYRAFS